MSVSHDWVLIQWLPGGFSFGRKYNKNTILTHSGGLFNIINFGAWKLVFLIILQMQLGVCILFIAKTLHTVSKLREFPNIVTVMSIVLLMTVQSIFQTISTYSTHTNTHMDTILALRLANDLHIHAYWIHAHTYIQCIHKLVCVWVCWTYENVKRRTEWCNPLQSHVKLMGSMLM